MAVRILITGATGYLGRRLALRAAVSGWSVVGTYFTAPSDVADVRLDIRDPVAVRDAVLRVRPYCVIHTAAGRQDWRSIADGAGYVAMAAATAGVRLVHVSSDAVFSGDAGEYDESAMPDPVYPYGAAKAAAETAVRAVTPDVAVVRTSLIVGDGCGTAEVLTHRLASGLAGGVLHTDEIRKPVHFEDLADALLELSVNAYRGVLHVAGADPVSRYDLGVLVARRDGLDPGRLPFGTRAERAARRPGDVRLRTDRARSLLSTRLRGVHEFMSVPDPFVAYTPPDAGPPSPLAFR